MSLIDLSNSSSSSLAIIAVDIEFTRHGRNLDQSRIMALGVVCIDLGKHLNVFSKQTLLNETILEKIIPKEDRLEIYIHDQMLISSYEESKFDNEYWEEIKGKEFWTRQDPEHKKLFKDTFQKMKDSIINETQAMEAFDRFVAIQIKKYKGQVLFISDTSNVDYPFIDLYRRKFLGNVSSINFLTGKGFVDMINTSVFYAGLLGKPFTFDEWDNFYNEKALKEKGYNLPEFTPEFKKEIHNPYWDAQNIALCFATIYTQLHRGSDVV